MYRHLLRVVTLTIVLTLMGCSGSGNSPVAPNLPGDNPADNSPSQMTDSSIPPPSSGEDVRILGNWHYNQEDGYLLAWGTILETEDGWDYRIDYYSPKLKALMASDVTREGQAIIDVRFLNLISLRVQYDDFAPEVLPMYQTGDTMHYQLQITDNTFLPIPNTDITATHVNLFNVPVDADSENFWDHVNIKKNQVTYLNDDWLVPDVPTHLYYTRVQVTKDLFGGKITLVIFDSKAGLFAINNIPQDEDPIAKGVTTTPTVEVGQNVHLQDNGSFDPDGGPIQLYEWDFNYDGTFNQDATGTSADTSYAAPGEYYVNLRVTDDEGNTDDLTDDPNDELIKITVTPPTVPPVAIAFTVPQSGFDDCTPVELHGENSEDPDGGDIVLYEWDVNNDGTYDEVGETISYTFEAGQHEVQLKVTDDENQTDTLDTPLTLVVEECQTDDPPDACATFSVNGVEDADPYICETVDFDGTCSTDDHGIDLYEWDFSYDGLNFDVDATGPTTSHSYVGHENGHIFSMRVTDTSGQTSLFIGNFDILNALPTALATVDNNSPEPGQEINFDGTDSHDNDCDGAEIVLYEWDFDFNGTFAPDTTGPTPAHTYPSEGIFLVQLRVTDDEGTMDMLDTPLTINVIAGDAPPTACATWTVGGESEIDPTVCQTIVFDGSCSTDDEGIDLYEWDLDYDGITFDVDTTGVSPFTGYTVPEVGHQVGLRVTDTGGQTDTTTIVFDILNALPSAIASVDNSNPAPGVEINFDGLASHDNDCDGLEIVSYEWDFDWNGITFDIDATGPTPAHTYGFEGTYEVQLRVTDDEGGQDMLDEALIINVFAENEPPTACASYDVPGNPAGAVPCDLVEFDGSCSTDDGVIVLYEWDFDGDGNWDFDDTTPFASHSYDDPNNYNVQLRVTDDEGAMDTLNTPLLVAVSNALPTAVAGADDTEVETGQTINFTGLESHDNDCDGASIDSYEWDFDYDGSTFNVDATGGTTSHSYSSPDTYTVGLRVTDDEGGTDIDGTLVITVSVPLEPPVAFATADPNPQTVCEDVTFSDDGSFDPDGGSITLWEWDFNYDGTFNQDATGSTVNHAFNIPGVYSVQLRVTDDEGATDLLDTALSITINNALPTASASVDNNNPEPGETINFDGTGSHDNDCTGSIDLYEWDFSYDGSTFNSEATGPTPSHSYPSEGNFDVQLRVTDDEGGTDLLNTPLTISVQAVNDPPTACATEDSPVDECNTVNFDGSCSTDDSGVVEWAWDFDGDASYDEFNAFPTTSHVYSDPGNYNVQLRVTDAGGLTDTLNVPLLVGINDVTPTASINVDNNNPEVGETINLDGLDSFDGDCGFDDIVSFAWDFEDDNSFDDTGSQVSHSYPAADTYTVRLRVTDNDGTTDDDTIQIVVSPIPNVPPTACAEINTPPGNPDVCETVQFDGGCSTDTDGTIVLYQWDWNGDGTYDEDDTTPINNHSFDAPNTYNVGLRVTDNDGATDTLDSPLVVTVLNVLPTANASASKTTVDVDEVFDLDGTTSTDNDCDGDSIDLYEWDMSWNGSTFNVDATGATPSWSYGSPGLYDIQLRVTDNEGGTDILNTPITITVLLAPACPTGIPDSISTKSVVGYSTFTYSVLPRADIAVIESGANAGDAIVQGGPNSLLRFEADAPHPVTTSFTLPTGAGAGTHIITNLDSAPYDDIVAVVTSDNPAQIKMIDSTWAGGPPSIEGTVDFPGGARTAAVDFDSNGDVWALVFDGSNVLLYGAGYTGTPGIYNIPVQRYNLNADIGTEVDVFDIAIDWTNNLLYVFDANTDSRGRLSQYDISDPENVFLNAQSSPLFGSAINFVAQDSFGIAGFADIDIDHYSGDEACHLVISAEQNGGYEFRKLDGDLALLNSFTAGTILPSVALSYTDVIDFFGFLSPAETSMRDVTDNTDW